MFERVALRMALRGVRRKGDNDAKQAIDQLLANSECMDSLLDELRTEHGRQMASGETPVIDFIKWLVQYLVDNQSAIIALIKAIVSLFAAQMAAEDAVPAAA
jgi:hypothetical protein